LEEHFLGVDAVDPVEEEQDGLLVVGLEAGDRVVVCNSTIPF